MREALVCGGIMAAVAATAIGVTVASPRPATMQDTSPPGVITPLPGLPNVPTAVAPEAASPISPASSQTPSPHGSRPTSLRPMAPLLPAEAPATSTAPSPPEAEPSTSSPPVEPPCTVGLILDPVLGVCVQL